LRILLLLLACLLVASPTLPKDKPLPKKEHTAKKTKGKIKKPPVKVNKGGEEAKIREMLKDIL